MAFIGDITAIDVTCCLHCFCGARDDTAGNMFCCHCGVSVGALLVNPPQVRYETEARGGANL